VQLYCSVATILIREEMHHIYKKLRNFDYLFTQIREFFLLQGNRTAISYCIIFNTSAECF